MSRSHFVAGAFVAATLAAAAQARPIFMQYDGIDGECSANSTGAWVEVGGQRVWQLHTPTGNGGIVFRPNAENADRPMESLSLNFTKISYATTPQNAGVEVGNDVLLDGRTFDNAVWAKWRNAGHDQVELSFGKSSQVDGELEIQIKSAGNPVGQNVCVGDIVGCWVLTALCPELECSIMCPALCGVPSTSRPDPSGGVAIDLPLGNPCLLYTSPSPRD